MHTKEDTRSVGVGGKRWGGGTADATPCQVFNIEQCMIKTHENKGLSCDQCEDTYRPIKVSNQSQEIAAEIRMNQQVHMPHMHETF